MVPAGKVFLHRRGDCVLSLAASEGGRQRKDPLVEGGVQERLQKHYTRQNELQYLESEKRCSGV
jgi:hypothetical protein